MYDPAAGEGHRLLGTWDSGGCFDRRGRRLYWVAIRRWQADALLGSHGGQVRALVQLTDERAAIGKHVGGSEPVAINVLARRVIERTSQSRVALLPYKAPYERGSEELRRGIPDPSWLHALTGWAAPRALNKNIDDGGAYEGSQDRAPIAIAKTA